MQVNIAASGKSNFFEKELNFLYFHLECTGVLSVFKICSQFYFDFSFLKNSNITKGKKKLVKSKKLFQVVWKVAREVGVWTDFQFRIKFFMCGSLTTVSTDFLLNATKNGFRLYVSLPLQEANSFYLLHHNLLQKISMQFSALPYFKSFVVTSLSFINGESQQRIAFQVGSRKFHSENRFMHTRF